MTSRRSPGSHRAAARSAAGHRARSRSAPRPAAPGCGGSRCSRRRSRPGRSGRRSPVTGCARRMTPTEGALLRISRAASSGRQTSSTPMRVTSGKPSARPDSVRVRPAATNARPRTVRTSPTGSSRWPPAGRHHGCRAHAVPAHVERTGTRRTRSCSTSAVDRRASWVSPVGMQPVGEHRHGQRLHVVGQDVVPAGERGVGPRRAQQVQAWRAARRPGAAPALERVAVTRSTTYCLTASLSVDLADRLDQLAPRCRRR